MKYPDSYLPAGNELEVDFTPEIHKRAEAKKLSSKDVNNLPDSDFAYISPGGTKDSEAKRPRAPYAIFLFQTQHMFATL